MNPRGVINLAGAWIKDRPGGATRGQVRSQGEVCCVGQVQFRIEAELEVPLLGVIKGSSRVRLA